MGLSRRRTQGDNPEENTPKSQMSDHRSASLLTKERRAAVPRSVRRALAVFYEGEPGARLRCVVEGDDSEIEIHHLNENPAESNSEFNLLPLGGDLNSSIDKRDLRVLVERITPQALNSRSAYWYSRGKYTYAYGCSVLGASLRYFVPWKQRSALRYSVDADTAAYASANALISLRPLNRINYATHVLKTFVSPLVVQHGDEIERPTRARLAMEIGSYFRDARELAMARRFAALARALLENEPNSGRVQTLRARLAQHDGITAIAAGDLVTARECFKKAREDTTLDYSIGNANEVLYEAQILLREKRPRLDAINELLAQFSLRDEADPFVMTKWTQAELLTTQADAAAGRQLRGDKRNAFATIREAFDFMQQHRIVPTGTILSPSLFAFAGVYKSHLPEVLGLVRAIPNTFWDSAWTIERDLSRLARRDR